MNALIAEAGAAKKRLRRGVVVALLLLTSAHGHAEIMVVDSLEWLSIQATLVVRGRVGKIAEDEGAKGIRIRDVRIHPSEVLKGRLTAQELVVRSYVPHPQRPRPTWQTANGEQLFFLRRGEVADHLALLGKWVLLQPQQCVISLDQPARAYFSNMTMAKSADKILATVQRSAELKLGHIRREIPLESEIFFDVFAGSSCYLRVPATASQHAHAMSLARSENADQRAKGAAMLGQFKDADSLALLNQLLQDDHEAKWIGQAGKVVRVTYPVRQAAYNSLKQRGQTHDDVLLERAPERNDDTGKD